MTAPLKLPAEVEAAIDAYGMARWQLDAQRSDAAREALRSAVLKYGDERISETRAERDAARAKLAEIDRRDYRLRIEIDDLHKALGSPSITAMDPQPEDTILAGAVIRYAVRAIAAERVERDAARAEVERLSQRDDEWRNFETEQRAACDRYLERTRAAETQLATVTVERDAAVALLQECAPCLDLTYPDFAGLYERIEAALDPLTKEA